MWSTPNALIQLFRVDYCTDYVNIDFEESVCKWIKNFLTNRT